MFDCNQAYCCACYFFNYLGRYYPFNSHGSFLLRVRQTVNHLRMHMYVKYYDSLRGIHITDSSKVAGLKEDLKLEGRQFSILLSLFTAG